MSTATLSRNTRHGLVLTVLVVSACLAGCDTVTVEPHGGQTLCLADYQQCVDPILHAAINGPSGGPLTCSAGGCHNVDSGSGGGFELYPDPNPTDPDFDDQILANFISAKAFANLSAPADSKLLLEPLQGVFAISGTHTGGDIFPDTNDACYVAMHDWISNRVSTRDDPGCGVCTLPDVSICGY
jgi:hypothetical protein